MFKGKSFLAFIPARAGSKSIKNKNLQKVGDKTILARSIYHAKNSKFVDEIVVSTNGKSIRKEAQKNRVEVIKRPQSISGPISSTEEAMLHAVEIKKHMDFIIVLQPTSPFRSPGLIDRCIERMAEEDADSLVTCWKFHNFCFYRLLEDGHWLSTFDYCDRPMHEQLTLSEFRFFDCGNLYLTRIPFFREKKQRLGGKILVEQVSMLDAMQIDSAEELRMCQNIANGEVE